MSVTYISLPPSGPRAPTGRHREAEAGGDLEFIQNLKL